MAIERIPAQDAAKIAAASPATVSYASTPTPGRLLICAVRTDKPTEPIVKDSEGAWTKAAGAAKGSALWAGVFYKIASATQPKDVTVEVSGATNCFIEIYEYSGAAPGSVLDTAKATESSSGGTTTTGAEITTAKAGELIFSFVGLGSNISSPSVDSEFSLRKTSVRTAAADAIKGAGTQKPQFSWTTAQNWVHVTAAFFEKEESPTPPEATTDAATSVGKSSAILHGKADPNGKTTSYTIELGESEGSLATVAEGSGLTGTSPIAKEHTATGLSPGTKYYFRISATNADGTVHGSILNFTTEEEPPPYIPVERIASQDAVKASAPSPAVASFPAPPLAGRLLIAAVRIDQSAEPTVKDTDGAWTKAAGAAKGANLWVGIFYKVATVGQPSDVTVEGASVKQAFVQIYEYKGLASSGVLDVATATASSAPATVSTGGTITSTEPGSLIFTTIGLGGPGSSFAVGSGFGLRQSNPRTADADAVRGPAEHSPQFTWVTAENFVHVTAAFIPSQEPPEEEEPEEEEPSPYEDALPFFAGAGQSNAKGTSGPTGSSESPTPDEGTAFEFNRKTRKLEPLEDPVADADTGSAWPSFAVKWNELTGKQMAFLGLSVGGTSQVKKSKPVSRSWEVGEADLYTEAIEEIQSALASLEGEGIKVDFKGVLWCQGENDAAGILNGLITPTEYKTQLEVMIAAFRSQFGPTMPFYIFRIGARRSSDPVGWQEVRKIQDEVAAADPYTYMVFTNAVNFPAEEKMRPAPEQDHYTQPGYNEMGTVGAENVVAAAEDEPTEPEPSDVALYIRLDGERQLVTLAP